MVYMTRGQWKQQILVGCFKSVWSGIDEHAKSDDKLVSQLYLNFFACGKKSIEVTNLFNHFKWMCSDVPKVIQNDKLDIYKYLYL